MARHTPGVHERVAKARVAIAGVGGLGSKKYSNIISKSWSWIY